MKRNATNLKNDVVVGIQAKRSSGKGRDVARAQECNAIGLDAPYDGSLAAAGCKAATAGGYSQRRYSTLMPTRCLHRT